MVAAVLDACIDELSDVSCGGGEVSPIKEKVLTPTAYICTLAFLLVILRFNPCIAAFG